MINRKLRMGMIGGGAGAFIRALHRIAANMDGQAELVGGLFQQQNKSICRFPRLGKFSRLIDLRSGF